MGYGLTLVYLSRSVSHAARKYLLPCTRITTTSTVKQLIQAQYMRHLPVAVLIIATWFQFLTGAAAALQICDGEHFYSCHGHFLGGSGLIGWGLLTQVVGRTEGPWMNDKVSRLELLDCWILTIGGVVIVTYLSASGSPWPKGKVEHLAVGLFLSLVGILGLRFSHRCAGTRHQSLIPAVTFAFAGWFFRQHEQETEGVDIHSAFGAALSAVAIAKAGRFLLFFFRDSDAGHQQIELSSHDYSYQLVCPPAGLLLAPC